MTAHTTTTKPLNARKALEETLDEYRKLKARMDGIEAALKERGLYAFPHVDGTFSLKDL